MRAEADKEGVHAYLRAPKTRARPNSRFLTATVLGVQHANKSVEVDEMWRAREKELELIQRSKNKSKERDRKHGINSSKERYGKTEEISSFNQNAYVDHDSIQDDGLGDDDIEKFLHSRAKRGRGSVGSRMDEPGPYPAWRGKDENTWVNDDVRLQEDWEGKIVMSHQSSSSNLKHHESASNIYIAKDAKRENSSRSTKKHHSRRKHHSKEKSRKKRHKEKRSKQHSQ
ncbi:hypothetical protein ZOSMA_56G00540 [Zostera marina]|uniref:Uncharacterized protein n=1 Tax=Zostera marina TaxID=29655 RepID=A0A0K9NVZ8_ZOSMR|nr:hypothetical protein ZOSMA_56G00540 [Zostera marina]